jgi:transcriptional antiterminator NusG
MFRWYVINTYSGHENKVKQNLEHRVVSLNQKRAVRQVVVPTETVQEMNKDNQKVAVEKRTMPGYVLVNMDLNEDSWGLVKGTPGVTGFVGASNEPIPLTQMEVDRMLKREVAVRAPSRAQFSIGEQVKVIAAPCQTSRARSPRSTRTPPSSRCSSRSSAGRPRSRWATTKLRRSRE